MGLPDRPPTSISKQNPTNGTIRWRKGELIGAGAFGRVYMGMNLDSGELLAVKQVLIATNNAAKQKAQAHLKGLEEEVKLLQKLSHPNIVRYVGTAREDDALNIFLEFVPGGSISSLISKFGAFPEPVIRNYSRELLTGLEYLHKNGIMHRDIKGANILVDNKGSIKVADFGASKQVVELVTTTVAKSVKGTAYWMAPEVIRQTGHNLKADIWSVGCTVIEMATGRPPWSQQFQEVAALFHIGTTNSHPPIPEHLSSEAQDFLLKCLQQEPELRPSASELLKHPFISGDVFHSPLSPEVVRVTKDSQILDNCKRRHLSTEPPMPNVDKSVDLLNKPEVVNIDYDKYADTEQFRRGSVGSDFNCSVRLDFETINKSFKSCTENPFWSQPFSFNNDADDGLCNFASPEIQRNKDLEYTRSPTPEFCEEKPGFSFKCSPVGEVNDDDDDEVTECKIKAFLDEKAEELKKLQTPLYMEFHSICNFQHTPEKQYPSTDRIYDGLPLPPSSIKSTSKSCSTLSAITTSRSCDSGSLVTSKNSVNGISQSTNFSSHLETPRVQVLRGILKESQQPLCSPGNLSLSDRQRLWKEELQQELAIKREELRRLSRVAPSPRLSRSASMHSLKRKQP